VESRSGGDDQRNSDKSDPKGPDASLSVSRLERPREGDGAEVTVHLKVGYKTVLLVVVVFDLVHLSLREAFNATWFEQLF
jgi:hypothetical protein